VTLPRSKQLHDGMWGAWADRSMLQALHPSHPFTLHRQFHPVSLLDVCWTEPVGLPNLPRPAVPVAFSASGVSESQNPKPSDGQHSATQLDSALSDCQVQCGLHRQLAGWERNTFRTWAVTAVTSCSDTQFCTFACWCSTCTLVAHRCNHKNQTNNLTHSAFLAAHSFSTGGVLWDVDGCTVLPRRVAVLPRCCRDSHQGRRRVALRHREWQVHRAHHLWFRARQLAGALGALAPWCSVVITG